MECTVNIVVLLAAAQTLRPQTVSDAGIFRKVAVAMADAAWLEGQAMFQECDAGNVEPRIVDKLSSCRVVMITFQLKW